MNSLTINRAAQRALVLGGMRMGARALARKWPSPPPKPSPPPPKAPTEIAYPEAFRVTVASAVNTKRTCFGCGADIAPTSEGGEAGHLRVVPTKGGYWEERKRELQKSKIKRWSLCARCDDLQRTEGSVSSSLVPPTAALEAFRHEVGKVRRRHAVVIYTVDAANLGGTLLRTLREYVGGNPVVVAVTRCDLLPPHLRNLDKDELRRSIGKRLAVIRPADVILTALAPGRREIGTPAPVQQLAARLLRNRANRDVFVVGAANIGKSTLTDALVRELVAQQGGHAFRSAQDQLRLQSISEMRVTRSALPGTTLQNIRVPVFADHMHALWDTPGLILSHAVHHFPIRGFEKLLRSQPRPITPQELTVGPTPTKFIVQLGEEGDDASLPLLRMVVRLHPDQHATLSARRAGTGSEKGPRILWSSLFGLRASVLLKPPPLQPPPPTPPSTREHEEAAEEGARARKLASLVSVGEFHIKANKGTDVSIANLGWFTLLARCDARVSMYAPSSGVTARAEDALGLPGHWLKGALTADPLGEDADFEEDLNGDQLSVSVEDFDDEDDLWKAMHEEERRHGPRDGGVRSGRGVEEPSAALKSLPMLDSTRREFPGEVPEWAPFVAGNVGWKYLDDTRTVKGPSGRLPEGWHPIPDPAGETIEDVLPVWRLPYSSRLHVEYPIAGSRTTTRRPRGMTRTREPAPDRGTAHRGRASKTRR